MSTPSAAAPPIPRSAASSTMRSWSDTAEMNDPECGEAAFDVGSSSAASSSSSASRFAGLLV